MKQQKLVDQIINKTVNLQSEFVFKIEGQFGLVADKDLEQELKRKREITLAN